MMKQTPLERRTELPRVSKKRAAAIEAGEVRVAHNSTLSGGGRIRPKPRTPEEFERVYGGDERRAWVSRLPSVASGNGPCVNAHVTPPDGLPSGTGRKGDYVWIVPLTKAEHDELHAIGEDTFQTKYGIDLAECAAETHAAWLDHINPDTRYLEPAEDALLEHRYGGEW